MKDPEREHGPRKEKEFILRQLKDIDDTLRRTRESRKTLKSYVKLLDREIAAESRRR